MNLFISLYEEKNKNRLDELILCLSHNIENKHISKIVILNEGFSHQILNHKKVLSVEFTKRPHYSDFLKYFVSREINIILNSDIYLDNTLKNLKYLMPKKRKVFVLTRYESTGFLFNRWGNSHDGWIFYDRPKALEFCDFHLGIPNCEQRLAAVMSDNDYYVLNPSLFIKSYHLHNSEKREYLLTKEIYSGVGLLVKPLGFFGTWSFFAILRFLRVNGITRRRTYLEDGSVYDKW
jgi:hypothetical protein